MNFSDGIAGRQSTPERYRRLGWLVGLLPASPQILEIGSWVGMSAVNFCEHLASNRKSGAVWCIDAWVPYLEPNSSSVSDIMNTAATNGEALKAFIENTKGLPVHILRGKSSDVCPMLADHRFDLVYIDGAHDYESVRHDIRQAKRLVKPGGIICGDDMEFPIDQAENYRSVANLEWFKPGHPGVTVAVHDELKVAAVMDCIWMVREKDGEFAALHAT